MIKSYDSYFDYDFDCNENIVDEKTNSYHDQIKAFNGGGSGG